MPQRPSRFAIFSRAMGRDHDAHAHAVDHAGQEYARDQEISPRGALNVEK
jgi:hypothetical protein